MTVNTPELVYLVLLKINNIKVNYTQQELIGVSIKTADGILKKEDILNWINEHIVN